MQPMGKAKNRKEWMVFNKTGGKHQTTGWGRIAGGGEERDKTTLDS